MVVVCLCRDSILSCFRDCVFRSITKTRKHECPFLCKATLTSNTDRMERNVSKTLSDSLPAAGPLAVGAPRGPRPAPPIVVDHDGTGSDPNGTRNHSNGGNRLLHRGINPPHLLRRGATDDDLHVAAGGAPPHLCLGRLGGEDQGRHAQRECDQLPASHDGTP